MSQILLEPILVKQKGSMYDLVVIFTDIGQGNVMLELLKIMQQKTAPALSIIIICRIVIMGLHPLSE